MIKHLSKPEKPSKASIARDNATKTVLNPQEVYDLVKPQLDTLVQEVAWVVCLDSMNRVLLIQEIGRGAVDHVEVNPREVFRPAIEVAAVAVMLMHNHPSDKHEPSPDDKVLTRRLIQAGQLIGIPFIDHIVVSKSGFTALSSKMPEFGYPELVGLL